MKMILLWIFLIVLAALVFVSSSLFDLIWLMAEIIITSAATIFVTVIIIAFIFKLLGV